MNTRFGRITAAVLLTGWTLASAFAEPIQVGDSDWPWWRGPDRNGIAMDDQSPPTRWSGTENIKWKAPVPGRGHGSPIVVGNQIYLATADEANATQSVIAFNRETGAQIWQTVVHKDGFDASKRQGHPRSSRASSTPASDGHRVFINFVTHGAVYTSALDLDGKLLWQQKVSDYVIHQGYGSSPAIYGPLVIASADNKGGGAIKAFDRVTGEPVWTVQRGALPNYASPIILRVDGKDQLLFTGHNLVSSFDPLTGRKNWESEGSTTECVTSIVTDGNLVVTSGGYPDKHTAVMRADGSGEELWRNRTEVYVPSMIIASDHLYGITDRGEAFCYALDNPEPVWEERVRGKFNASPVLVGDTLYALDANGTMHLFNASPTGFEPIAQNTIPATEVEATPAICGNQIYIRVANEVDGKRQEMLYCIAE